MITSAICSVNAIRSQKPRPHASTICPALDGVNASADPITMMVASSAKINASGIQRSLHAVSVSARRATGPGSRSWPGRSAFKILGEPGDDTVQTVDEVLLLAQSVRFARVEDEVGIDVVPLQPAVELLALADRIGGVILALQQQRRRADVLDECHRRALDEPVEP